MTKRLTVALIIPALFSFFTAWRMASAGSARAAATLFSRKERPGMFKHHLDVSSSSRCVSCSYHPFRTPHRTKSSVSSLKWLKHATNSNQASRRGSNTIPRDLLRVIFNAGLKQRAV